MFRFHVNFANFARRSLTKLVFNRDLLWGFGYLRSVPPVEHRFTSSGCFSPKHTWAIRQLTLVGIQCWGHYRIGKVVQYQQGQISPLLVENSCIHFALRFFLKCLPLLNLCPLWTQRHIQLASTTWLIVQHTHTHTYQNTIHNEPVSEKLTI